MPFIPLLPEVLAIGYHESRRASPWLPHFHDRLYEVHYLEAGMVPTLLGEAVVQLAGGQGFASPPYHIHGGRYQVLGPSKLYWLTLAAPTESPVDAVAAGAPHTFLGLTAPESEALTEALSTLGGHVFAASAEMVTAFHALRRLVPSRREPIAVAEIRARVLTVLTEAVRHSKRTEREPNGELVRQALRAIEARIGNPETIDALSKRLGWSRQHVQEAFRAEVGLGPGDYWLYRRIMQGCTLLETTELPVTQIAHGLGFASSQYFSTAFKRLMGTPPLDFRKRVQDAPLREPARHALPYSPRERV